MSTRAILPLATLLTLTTAGSGPLAAQAIALRDGPTPRPPTLAATYHLTLTSEWPGTGATEGCDNGGEEVVEGTLTRNSPGRYQGTFRRRTTLRFCGAHGASEVACTMTLNGSGRVAAVGDVVTDERSTSGRALRLRWTPEADHTAETEGACAPRFKDKVRAMYLSVRHGVEFPLPEAGAAPRTERLEGYAWTVAIE
jgi:hypothetical protein